MSAFVSSFQAHSNAINTIKQSPFNTNTNYVSTCSGDYKVRVWDVYSSLNWTLIQTYNHSSEVMAMEWLNKDTLASSGLMDQTIKIWSIATGQTKNIINTNRWVFNLKFLNNKIHLAADVDKDINIYNINDGNLVSSLKGHTQYVNDLVLISNDLLASASRDNTIRIWNLTTNTCKFILTGHNSSVNGIKQITSSILASGSSDATIKLWDITSGQEIRTLTGHTHSIRKSVDLLNSQTLVSGSWDGTIKLWNWSTGECLSTIQTNSTLTFYSIAVIDIN
jgi:WD40 repeat protein